MPRTKPYDQPPDHPRKDRHDRLVYRADPLHLEVVRGDEGADEEDAEDAESPSGRFSETCWGQDGMAGLGRRTGPGSYIRQRGSENSGDLAGCRGYNALWRAPGVILGMKGLLMM